MRSAELSTMSTTTAAEIRARYEPSPAVARIECGDLTPRQLVDVLVESGLYLDTIDFLAHALPKREAVWWACLGVRHTLGAALPPKEFAALKAAVEWVLEPDEPKRRAAQAAGEAADFGTPAGCAALAVYGSGGSLTSCGSAGSAPGTFHDRESRLGKSGDGFRPGRRGNDTRTPACADRGSGGRSPRGGLCARR